MKAELQKIAYKKVFENGVYDPDFQKVFIDLLERAADNYETEIRDAIWEAIDEGLIYSADEWTVYKHYCNIGDNRNIMDELLFCDLYNCLEQAIKIYGE